jgi:PAS domain S-box-containing protein
MSNNPGANITDLTDEQRFRLLVANVRDYAIYLLDPEGYVSSWNVGAQRFKGYLPNEIIGKHFSVFYTEEERAAGIPGKALQTALDEGKFEAEGWRVRKDGSKFWAHVVLDPVRNEQGVLVGFAKITRDITEKKQAAEALERANGALFQSQKLEAIGQLTGGIAHDFNNLLAVISSGLDVLSLHVSEACDTKLLESMRRAVDRGATLIEKLLSFARQQALTVEKYSLNGLIANFEGILQRAIDSSIEFEVRLHAALDTVLLDAARFEAALLNLIINARDAMPNGGKLTVATENIELGEREIGGLAAGSYVKLCIADTGTGMSPDVAARAFEPFFTTKGVGKGTGLGLSQVYGFMAQSAGEVILETTLDKGTIVCVYLPVIVEKRAAANERETVLIVEDEPDLREVAEVIFHSIGYAVVTAANARDAMEALKRRENVDILFTDVMMPNGMSGIDLARFTRQNFPAIKIILASGYPLPALQAKHGNLDGFEFMSKPYRLAELEKKLRAFA